MRHAARRISLATLLGALWVGLGGRTDAAIVVYTDRTAFDAVTTGQTTIDFEGLAPVDGFTFFASPPGLTVGSVNFQSLSDRLFVIDPGYPGFAWTSGQYLIDNTFNNDPLTRGLVVDLGGATSAVGTDVSSFGTGNITITLSTGDVVIVASPGQPDLTFIGITSNIPILSMVFNKTTGDLNEPGDSIVLDNFTTATLVPEPGTVFSAASALFLGAGYAWRRRAKARTA